MHRLDALLKSTKQFGAIFSPKDFIAIRTSGTLSITLEYTWTVRRVDSSLIFSA